ncbi:transglycosylase family protein [Candidatus Protofrankia californiensis]|uniref:transglycosylase family protein n=1 Tax=Candidatus Protofrankia californiensis TaxID=1839754 RepID=UPI0010418A77|nr:transglycosylase family protein [Candidatus Protofrankia californiensis]
MSSARSRSRHHGTGRARMGARALVVAPALVAAVGGSIVMSQPASAATTWAELRQCESGGNYTVNTGNGYYGAYQFALSTWQGLGYTGLPSGASPATQDEAALRLAVRSGFGQWPICGQGMGADQLAADASSSGAGSASPSSPSDSTRTRRLVVRQSAESLLDAPDSTLFTTGLIHQVRSDVRAWQLQMNALGYKILIDGRYGPQSAFAAGLLQGSKGLRVDGICGPRTRAATFA